MIGLVILWIILSYLCGIFAKNKGYSFWTYFLISLIITPIVGFIGVLVSPKNEPEPKNMEDYNRLINEKNSADMQNKKENDNSAQLFVADEILKLSKLKDEGIITGDEFEVKKKQLLRL